MEEEKDIFDKLDNWMVLITFGILIVFVIISLIFIGFAFYDYIVYEFLKHNCLC